MVADTFKGLLTFRGVRSGANYLIPIDADDVAGNRIDFPQTGLEHWTPPEDVDLIDIVNTEDGADTTRWELYVNGMQTSYSFVLGSLVATVPLPRLAAHPRIAANSTVQLYQRA